MYWHKYEYCTERIEQYPCEPVWYGLLGRTFHSSNGTILLSTMPVKTVRFYTLALVLVDILAVLAAFTLAYIVRVQLDSRPLVNQISAIDFLVTFLQLLPFWFITLWGLGLYSPSVYQKRLTEMGKLLVGSFIGILLIIGYQYVIAEPLFPARLVPVYGGLATFIFLVAGRELLRFIRDLLYHFNVGTQRVMVIGRGEATHDIIENLHRTTSSGYRVVATVNTKYSKQISHYTSLDSALKDLDWLRIDTIIQTDLDQQSERNQRIMGAAQARHIQYCFIPGEPEFYSGKNQIDVFLGYPIIAVHQTPLVGWGELVKRVFDLLFIAILSPVWVPFMLVIALLQKLCNPGPLFFLSSRLGLYGKEIGTYKFRSMKAEYSGGDAAKIFRKMGRDDLAEQYEKTRKIDNDPRITTFGKFLRATSIDELPQIFNVIRGDMSLVGPRPIIKEEKKFYQGRAPLLFSVRPGITGLWQVSGRSDLPFEKRVDLELYYAQNWSFWMDMKILFKTIRVVVLGAGAR